MTLETKLFSPPPRRLEVLTPKLLAAVAGEPSLYGALTALAEGFVEIFGALAANVRVLRADRRALDLISACGIGASDEPPTIKIAYPAPACWAVRRHTIQFVSSEPVPRRTRSAGVQKVAPNTLFALPLIGDDRILGAVSGCFNVTLAPSDCEQLADLGRILGGLMEMGLLSPSGVTHFDPRQSERHGKSGFWKRDRT